MILFDEARVYSRAHAPTWMMLAAAAGCMNAGAYLACQRFVTHVTGVLTSVGTAGRGTLAFEFSIVFVFFVAGAMASVFLIDGRHHQGKRPYYALPLLLTAGLAMTVAVMGMLEMFGPLGGDPAVTDRPMGFALLSLLSLASGLQNAAVSTTTKMVVRTTHMTGPTTDFGINLATAFFASGDERSRAVRGAAMRGGKIASFLIGGCLAVPLAKHVGYGVFLAPAALVIAGTLRSFVPEMRALDAAAAATVNRDAPVAHAVLAVATSGDAEA